MNVQNRWTNPEKREFTVVGEIPGTDLKDEVVMIGAHYDSWYSGTGATDNGAGSLAMLEAMRILKTLNLPMRRTVRIALWSGEEQGLLGSRALRPQAPRRRCRRSRPTSTSITDRADSAGCGASTTKRRSGSSTRSSALPRRGVRRQPAPSHRWDRSPVV